MGGCRPGPASHNPFSRFGAPRTPGPLGRYDAADPNWLSCRGDTPGPLGLNDDAAFVPSRLIDPMGFDDLVSHREIERRPVPAINVTS
jgi:hypothetical protein